MTNKERMTKAKSDFKTATRGEDVRDGICEIADVVDSEFDEIVEIKAQVNRKADEVESTKKAVDNKAVEVARTGNAAVNEINSTKASAVKEVNEVKDSAISGLNMEKIFAVGEVNKAKDTAKTEIDQTATSEKSKLDATIRSAETTINSLKSAESTAKNTDVNLSAINNAAKNTENSLASTITRADEANKKLQGNLEGSDLSGLQKLTKENKVAVEKVASDLQTAKTDLERKIDNKDLSAYATKSELTSYAKTSSLSSYAKKSDLNDYAIAHEVESAFDEIHSDYATNSKVNELESKVNEAFQSADDGKKRIASAIIGKGGSGVSNDSTFPQLANAISNIKTGYGAGETIPSENIEQELDTWSVSVSNPRYVIISNNREVLWGNYTNVTLVKNGSNVKKISVNGMNAFASDGTYFYIADGDGLHKYNNNLSKIWTYKPQNEIKKLLVEDDGTCWIKDGTSKACKVNNSGKLIFWVPAPDAFAVTNNYLFIVKDSEYASYDVYRKNSESKVRTDSFPPGWSRMSIPNVVGVKDKIYITYSTEDGMIISKESDAHDVINTFGKYTNNYNYKGTYYNTRGKNGVYYYSTHAGIYKYDGHVKNVVMMDHDGVEYFDVNKSEDVAIINCSKDTLIYKAKKYRVKE